MFPGAEIPASFQLVINAVVLIGAFLGGFWGYRRGTRKPEGDLRVAGAIVTKRDIEPLVAALDRVAAAIERRSAQWDERAAQEREQAREDEIAALRDELAELRRNPPPRGR